MEIHCDPEKIHRRSLAFQYTSYDHRYDVQKLCSSVEQELQRYKIKQDLHSKEHGFEKVVVATLSRILH